MMGLSKFTTGKPLRFFSLEQAVNSITVNVESRLGVSMNRETDASRGNKKEARQSFSTRESILYVAEKLFAERGYEAVTSKEICEQAKVNLAAVNYYFGGKEALYQEVLADAQAQSILKDILDGFQMSTLTAEEKLEIFFKNAVGTANFKEIRKTKIILRELTSLSPTICKDSAPYTTLRQIKQNISEIIHLISDLPMGSPEMERATAFVVFPLSIFIIGTDIQRVFNLSGAMNMHDELARDFFEYSMGGLLALRQAYPFKKPLAKGVAYEPLLS